MNSGSCCRRLTKPGSDRIGSDRTGLTKPGSDRIRLTKPGSDQIVLKKKKHFYSVKVGACPIPIKNGRGISGTR